MTIWGIDVGQKGGVAVWWENNMTAKKMPLINKEIDIAKLALTVKPDLVIIEKVHAMPKQGVTSMFNFGKGYGELIGMCKALGYPYQLVTPQAWKKEILGGTKKDKVAAINYVMAKYPHVELIGKRCRFPHDGMADAVCMCEYGRRLA